MSHTPDCAPAIFFDAVYVSAVLHNFGTQEVKDVVTKVWKDPGRIMTGADADHKVPDEQTLNEAQEPYKADYGPDTFNVLLALPYIFV